MAEIAVRVAPGTGLLARRQAALLLSAGPDVDLVAAFSSAPDGGELQALASATVAAGFAVGAFVAISWDGTLRVMAFGDLAVETDRPSLPMLTGAGSRTWVEHSAPMDAAAVVEVHGAATEATTDLVAGTVFAGGFRLEVGEPPVEAPGRAAVPAAAPTDDTVAIPVTDVSAAPPPTEPEPEPEPVVDVDPDDPVAALEAIQAAAVGADGRPVAGPGVVSRASPRASERSDVVSRASPRASERSDVVSRASPRASERSDVVSRASPRASERSDVVSRASDQGSSGGPAPPPRPTLPEPTVAVPDPIDPDVTLPPPASEALLADVLQGEATEGRSSRVDAKLCTGGHANPPTAATCAICGDLLAPGTAAVAHVPRPSLGRLLLDDGEVVVLDQGLLIGRNPDRDDDPARAGLRRVKTPGEKVSRSHLEVRFQGWDVLVTDCDSTNGTFVVPHPGGQVTALQPGRPQLIDPGAVVYFGSRSFTLVGREPDA